MLDLRDPPSPADIVERDAETRPQRERFIRCASCAHVLAKPSARTKVSGAHQHSFRNPAGIDFHVSCFREAGGVLSWGEASAVWTWFPGYAWRIALCAGCTNHVGWSFSNDRGSGFVALVNDAFREGD